MEHVHCPSSRFVKAGHVCNVPPTPLQAPPPRPTHQASRPEAVREDAPHLAHGTFDEAESHSSFLEALNAWRASSRAAASASEQSNNPATVINAPAACPQQLRPTSGTAAHATKASTSHTSTSTSTGNVALTQPASQTGGISKPVSYFDRLLLNSASRHAGQEAAGCREDAVGAQPAAKQQRRQQLRRQACTCPLHCPPLCVAMRSIAAPRFTLWMQPWVMLV